jgi:polar amino acid transport system substrate-binding protein
VLKNKLNISRVAMVTGEQAVAQNIKRLVLGRIDVYVEAQAVVRFQAGKDGQADLLESAGILNATPLYVAFSPQCATSAAYARMLAEGVDELRATGKLDDILHKYALHDWKRDEAQQ